MPSIFKTAFRNIDRIIYFKVIWENIKCIRAQFVFINIQFPEKYYYRQVRASGSKFSASSSSRPLAGWWHWGGRRGVLSDSASSYNFRLHETEQTMQVPKPVRNKWKCPRWTGHWTLIGCPSAWRGFHWLRGANPKMCWPSPVGSCQDVNFTILSGHSHLGILGENFTSWIPTLI